MSSALFASLILSIAALTGNPCTNGSFEDVGPDGVRPVDWQYVDETVELTNDAHSGQYAIRLKRTPDTATPETGLNRDWTVDSGQGGAMIGHLKGGFEFWYKAISADATQISIGTIPMNKRPFEAQGARRIFYRVPEDHIGDGQWHRARMAYDYSDNEDVAWVHFAVRLEGDNAEVLLDDVSWLEYAGPLVTISRVRLEESETAPGREATVYARVSNVGDEPADAVDLRFATPDNLDAKLLTPLTTPLPVGGRLDLRWSLTGERSSEQDLVLRAEAAGIAAQHTIAIAPEVELESYGPVTPVAVNGQPVDFECVLKNTGNAIAKDIAILFGCDGLVPNNRAVSEIAPGEKVIARGRFRPVEDMPKLPASLAVRDHKGKVIVRQVSSLVVASKEWGSFNWKDTLSLGDDHVRLVFLPNAFGYGPGALCAKQDGQWHVVGWLPRLGRLVYQDGEQNEYATDLTSNDAPTPTKGHLPGYAFAWTHTGPDTNQWSGTVAFEWDAEAQSFFVSTRLATDTQQELLCFEAPMVYALNRDEAIYPGLEWLVEDEVSSSTLDIEEGHELQHRYVVDPFYITIPAIGVHGDGVTIGLLWDMKQTWDGTHERPSAVFASPSRFEGQRAHLMGLMAPPVPEYADWNTRQARPETPYTIAPDQPLRLTCQILVQPDAPDALSAVDAWFDRYGFPEPAPLPRGSYDREIEFSMQAYLDSLWDPETQQWWTSKGGHPLMSKLARPAAYLADIALGANYSPSPDMRAACRERIATMAPEMGLVPRLEYLLTPGRLDLVWLSVGPVASALASRDADGGWRFDPDQEATGVFEGLDYRTLADEPTLELGTCANNARNALRFARIAGDWSVYESMVPTLELMASFDIPRAAQVWEVPAHSPDILAAAYAIDAFLDAYRLSGEQRWLDEATRWARKGLNFVYFWDDAGRPYLLGASIPVYGATFRKWPWFGRPVQWCGLAYADSILDLQVFDQSYPWSQIAETILVSALHQQASEGQDVALWPDSIDADDMDKSPWLFSPRQILSVMNKLLDRSESPRTRMLGNGRDRIHFTVAANIIAASWDGATIMAEVGFPKAREGVAIFANMARPDAVYLNGEAIPERVGEIECEDGAAWRYDVRLACLTVKVAHDGRSTIRVKGARFRRIERLPSLKEDMAFDFVSGAQGWTAANDVSALTAASGELTGHITGDDPYIIRPFMRFSGDDVPKLQIRMRATAGSTGQVYWSTDQSPSVDENKVMMFDMIPDGAYHDYVLDMASHPHWRGHTITLVRIDPGNGATQGEFAIQYLGR